MSKYGNVFYDDKICMLGDSVAVKGDNFCGFILLGIGQDRVRIQITRVINSDSYGKGEVVTFRKSIFTCRIVLTEKTNPTLLKAGGAEWVEVRGGGRIRVLV